MKLLNLILLAGLLICTVEDVRRRMVSVPFIAVWTMILCGIRIWQGRCSIGLLLGVILTVSVACAISWCSGGQIGMGDGFLFGMTAMGLGIVPNLYMLAYCLTAVFGMAVILLALCRKSKTTRIPLAPFLLFSSLLVIS